jgi:hypothetical protein
MDYHFSRLIPALLLAVLPLAGESAGGLNWEAPAAWKSEPRQMRAANYVIPPAAGDSEPGECAVYYFGPGQGGGVEANVRRWISQFEAPSGGPADALTKRSEKTVNGIKLTILDVAGTYLFKPFPMAPQAATHRSSSNSRRLKRPFKLSKQTS